MIQPKVPLLLLYPSLNRTSIFPNADHITFKWGAANSKSLQVKFILNDLKMLFSLAPFTLPLKMETSGPSDKLVSYCSTTHHDQDYLDFNFHCHENLKSCISYTFIICFPLISVNLHYRDF